MAQRTTIVADILPAHPSRTDRMVRTRTGIVIGIAHQRPAARPTRDAEVIQRALLDHRARPDWDGLAIAAFIAVTALAAVFA